MREYKHLTPEEREFFLTHGWLKVEGAIKQQYIDEWMKDFWVRLGYDEHDKSTWEEEYTKLPRHREVRCEEFCPKAWDKMLEIVGGEEVVDPVRERYYGDQFIINFGSEERTKQKPIHPREYRGWHTDNDWYRHFLDSSGNALTIIHCFTDIPERGGGTCVAEDGIKRLCEKLYEHPEGLDPPFPSGLLYSHVAKECEKFSHVVAKAGDVIITHGLLPHSHSPNYLHYARVITNPHLNMAVPFNLNREDGDYTLAEQVILRALDRTSIPEYKPTRERLATYPRTAYFKREKVKEELVRMIKDAESKGKSAKDVDSVYLRGEEAILEHERRNGYDKPWGPHGVQRHMKDNEEWVPTSTRHVLV
ncbi:hypothetical protein BD324DRAFT_616889 [Kockovaella imperatae]|uniref:Phytanoyl-CoA dioxygenase n=1 Tax=Kockovaella imperatae TaxID=4999 RepID=A0A1Y1USP0_9TREE|nr:hypothetical protein BD324DRAFT_616889 [Kockovaella imperatae]ORX40215.1 hypothetical protein BD324DRAFT_616889 [Kockovaella imperatae]